MKKQKQKHEIKHWQIDLLALQGFHMHILSRIAMRTIGPMRKIVRINNKYVKVLNTAFSLKV